MTPPAKLVLATGNRGKLAELRRLLSPAGFDVVSQDEFAVPPVEEDGITFVENALKKARAAAAASGLPALADDSGLAVDALDGAPGVRSARFAGDDADDAANNQRLLAELAGVADDHRGAAFHCVLVLVQSPEDPVPVICHGRWPGRIVRQPAGSGGFGYDPLFLPDGSESTAAELAPEDKARVSHRGRALARLLAELGGAPPA